MKNSILINAKMIIKKWI